MRCGLGDTPNSSAGVRLLNAAGGPREAVGGGRADASLAARSWAGGCNRNRAPIKNQSKNRNFGSNDHRYQEASEV